MLLLDLVVVIVPSWPQVPVPIFFVPVSTRPPSRCVVWALVAFISANLNPCDE